MSEQFFEFDKDRIVISPYLWVRKLRLTEASALPKVKQPGNPSQGRAKVKDELGPNVSFALGYPARPGQLGARGYKEHSPNAPECHFNGLLGVFVARVKRELVF